MNDIDNRLEQRLRQGHPEVDINEPVKFAEIRDRAVKVTTSSNRARWSRWVGAAGLGAAAFVCAITVVVVGSMVLSGGGGPAPAGSGSGKKPVAGSAPPSSDRSTGTAREVFNFDSIAEMVATSDLVVEGTVTAVRPGRVLEVDGGHTFQFTDVDVAIKEVLAGGQADTRISLEIDQGLFPRLGTSEVWPKVGADYFLFLHEKADNGRLRPTSSNGVLMIDGASVRSEQMENVLGDSLDGTSVESVRAAIEASAGQSRPSTAPGTSPPTK